MKYVWVIELYQTIAPKIERYELIQINKESVTVQCRSAPKVIRNAGGRSFHYSIEDVNDFVTKILNRKISIARGDIQRYEEMLKSKDYNIYEIPSQRPPEWDNTAVELD